MDSKKTPLAIAIFAEIISIVCTFLVALFPNFAIRIFGSWTHGIDWESIWQPSFNAIDLIIGFVSLFVFVYLATWAFVKIYQAIVK